VAVFCFWLVFGIPTSLLSSVTRDADPTKQTMSSSTYGDFHSLTNLSISLSLLSHTLPLSFTSHTLFSSPLTLLHLHNPVQYPSHAHSFLSFQLQGIDETYEEEPVFEIELDAPIPPFLVSTPFLLLNLKTLSASLSFLLLNQQLFLEYKTTGLLLS
jgi:hypothetical protein